jgi:P27 family predicted phage terminase small subunit
LRGDAIALRIWREEAPRLQVLGLLGSIDRLAFAALCERAALYQRTARTLRRRTGLIQATSGGDVARPEVYISRAALEGFRRLAGDFGMTPADRARLMVEPPTSPAKKSARAQAVSRWAGLLS